MLNNALIQKLSFVFIALFCAISIVLAFSFKSYAYETSCPEGMSDQDCLNYLRDQAQQIGQAASSVEDQLSQEKFEQLNITQQINYLNSQITSREQNLSAMELDLAAKNIEIKMLNKDIEKLQDNIDVANQEIDRLNEIIDKRLTFTYKFGRMDLFEIVLYSGDVDTIFRKLKYLTETRKKDKEALVELNYQKTILAEQQDSLNRKISEIEQMRVDITAQKTEIYNEKATLDTQRAQYEVLVAESRARESAYQDQLNALYAQQNEIDRQTTEMIMRMFHEGQLANGTRVEQGQIIGFQGHTGCSYGSHLHYGIISPGSDYNWYTTESPFNGHVSLSGNFVVSNAGSAPLDSGYLTQGPHSGQFLDIVSLSAGNQSYQTYGYCWNSPTENQCYWLNYGDLQCDPYTQGWFPLQGEGAPVYALYSGVVSYGVESWGGAKFALIVHDNGYKSIYVHLR
ncbi:MAG TPA: hypothetical protein PLX79_01075 [Candidatus Dojkabacteria bacterium]|nr:hypothetical protein [Candidatus Dojkabacteria bacterium]